MTTPVRLTTALLSHHYHRTSYPIAKLILQQFISLFLSLYIFTCVYTSKKKEERSVLSELQFFGGRDLFFKF